MGKLRADFFNSGSITATSIDLPISSNNYEAVWVIEQITVKYSKPLPDAPTVTVLKNSESYSGPAQMLPGNNGQGQTFAGVPYLYKESDDIVIVRVQNGTAGALVTVQVQYRVIGYDSDELEGRF